MDAVFFLKTISRMCNNYNSQCSDCPIGIESKKEYLECYNFIKFHIEEAVEIVEKWMKEHPAKTRKSALLEIFPTVILSEDGIPIICPHDMGQIGCHTTCEECCKEFWTEEIE